MSHADLLRRAADEIDQTASSQDVWRWTVLTRPVIAASLAALLRHTANAVWTYPPLLEEWRGGGDGEYHAGEAAKAAVAIARALLGETGEQL